MSRYLQQILARFERQEAKGILKYGQILEDNPRGPVEALEFLAEELTDGLMYIEEAIEKIKQPDSAKGMAYLTEETLKQKVKLIDELAAYKEENDLQRASIQQLSSQVVAYRKAITDCPIEAKYGCNCLDCRAVRNCENVLLLPDPGAEIRERMAKLEAVAKAVIKQKQYFYRKCEATDQYEVSLCNEKMREANKELEQALAALENPLP